MLSRGQLEADVVLEYRRDALAPRGWLDLGHVDAVHPQRAGCRAVQAQHQLGHCGLAGAVSPHQGDALTGLNGQVHPIEDERVGTRVSEADAGEADGRSGAIRENNGASRRACIRTRTGRGVHEASLVDRQVVDQVGHVSKVGVHRQDVVPAQRHGGTEPLRRCEVGSEVSNSEGAAHDHHQHAGYHRAVGELVTDRQVTRLCEVLFGKFEPLPTQP